MRVTTIVLTTTTTVCSLHYHYAHYAHYHAHYAHYTRLQETTEAPFLRGARGPGCYAVSPAHGDWVTEASFTPRCL